MAAIVVLKMDETCLYSKQSSVQNDKVGYATVNLLYHHRVVALVQKKKKDLSNQRFLTKSSIAY